MLKYTTEELQEAVRAITSMVNKSEKALQKLVDGTWQHTMTGQSLYASYLSLALLNKQLALVAGTGPTADAISAPPVEAALREALATNTETIGRVEKVLPKFAIGTPQHTLAIRRIAALTIASALIKQELEIS